MPLYRYVKGPPSQASRRRRPIIVSLLLIASGSMLLLWVAWPILSFTFVSEGLFVKTVAPISDVVSSVKSNNILSPIVLAASDANTPIQPAGDFTNANAWFPTLPQKKVVTPVNTYHLTIPKLKINNATVVIGADDLGKSLIHYGGTGLPGDYGNAVIFGHSTLPQFYSPTDYKTIFSLVPTLKEGDEIMVDYDGVTYTYSIFEMVVTEPTDLSNLEQRFDDSYLTIVTCVPPGTYWKRLYVKGKLVRPT